MKNPLGGQFTLRRAANQGGEDYNKNMSDDKLSPLAAEHCDYVHAAADLDVSSLKPSTVILYSKNPLLHRPKLFVSFANDTEEVTPAELSRSVPSEH